MIKKNFLFTFFLSSLIISSCNDSEFAGNKKNKTYEERYKELEEAIKNSTEWTASIEKKAKERNIPTDSMIKLDIIWTLDEQDGKHKPENQPPVVDTTNKKPYDERLKEIIATIRASKEWMESIAKKAKDQQIPLDSMLIQDARWMIDEQDGKHK